MTLLITVFAASVLTIIWYSNPKARELKIGTLTLAYWGASVMWLVDSVAEYLQQGEEFFRPSASQMLNDTFLGLSAAVLGFAVWTVYIIIKNPKNIIN